jgi:hypothetical protein
VQLFFAGRYPDANAFEGAPSRVVGVARFRDSKVFANDAAEIVCIRAWKNEALLRNGVAVDVVRSTEEHGVFAFALTDPCSYSLNGVCALVENPVVFSLLERLQLDIGMAILGRGRISDRLLDWLAQNTTSDFSIIHLPDYDPIGLSEFARMRARLHDRIALYRPANLPRYFDQFSNRALLDRGNSQAVLRYLRKSADRQIRAVLDLIDKHNAGVEQEALLLDV